MLSANSEISSVTITPASRALFSERNSQQVSKTLSLAEQVKESLFININSERFNFLVRQAVLYLNTHFTLQGIHFLVNTTLYLKSTFPNECFNISFFQILRKTKQTVVSLSTRSVDSFLRKSP